MILLDDSTILKCFPDKLKSLSIKTAEQKIFFLIVLVSLLLLLLAFFFKERYCFNYLDSGFLEHFSSGMICSLVSYC